MISSSENRVSYDGDGLAKEFAYQFKILEKSDIKVMLVKPDGSTQILSKDYYVDAEKSVVVYPGYAPGAEIPESERPPVLPTGWRLVLYREVPITQLSKLLEQWPFNIIEDALDKLTIICQQLDDNNQRSLKLSPAVSNNVNTILPHGKRKTFAWSEDGTHLELTENPADVLPQVNQKILDLQDYVETQTEEIQKLVESLNSLTREELLKLRDECKEYKLAAEKAALLNVRWQIGNIKTRDPSKPTYGLDGNDLIINVPDVIKLTVLGDSNV